jgi:hypothetical protein
MFAFNKKPQEEAKPTQPPFLPENQMPQVQPREEYAPIFVKVERFKEVVEDLQSLRGHISSLKDLLSTIAELQIVVTEATIAIQQRVDKMTLTTEDLSNQFLKPKGMDMDGLGGHYDELRGVTQEIHAELEKVRENVRQLAK